MKREGTELALMVAVMCLAIVGAVVIMTSLAGADNQEVALPEPTYTTPAEIILMRAEAPERANTGLVTYETFNEALERAKAAVPDELAELAGRAIWGEAGGIQDEAQRAAVVWCACNRADAWDMEIGDVLTVDQFHGLAIRGEVPPSTSNWHGTCWRGGRLRLRDGKMLAGCCRVGFSILRGMEKSITSRRNMGVGSIGAEYYL